MNPPLIRPCGATFPNSRTGGEGRGNPDDTRGFRRRNGHGAVKTAPYKAPVYGRP